MSIPSSDPSFRDPYGPNIEIEWTVLPYDVPNKTGKNIVLRYDTMVNNTSTEGNVTVMETDSSGRGWIKRVKDYRPNIDNYKNVYPIAENYYPVTSRVRITGIDEISLT